MNFNEYYEIIKEKTAAKMAGRSRFSHSLAVAETAERLVRRYQPHNIGLAEKARLAGLVHDYAKYETEDDFRELIRKYHLPTVYTCENKHLYHGTLGWLLIRDELGIDDEEILAAVACHTTGKAVMNFLEECIYLADFIEETRSGEEFASVRAVAFTDYKRAIAMETTYVLQRLLSEGRKIDVRTLECYNAYRKYLRGIAINPAAADTE